MFSWTYLKEQPFRTSCFKTRNVLCFGAIKRSLELNWGVKRKMYSSVFSFFQVLTVLFPAWGFLCVSVHCGEGHCFLWWRQERQGSGHKVTATSCMCHRLLCVAPRTSAPAFRHVKPAQCTLIVRQILTTQSLIHSSWLIQNSLCRPSWPCTQGSPALLSLRNSGDCRNGLPLATV